MKTASQDIRRSINIVEAAENDRILNEFRLMQTGTTYGKSKVETWEIFDDTMKSVAKISDYGKNGESCIVTFTRKPGWRTPQWFETPQDAFAFVKSIYYKPKGTFRLKYRTSDQTNGNWGKVYEMEKHDVLDENGNKIPNMTAVEFVGRSHLPWELWEDDGEKQGINTSYNTQEELLKNVEYWQQLHQKEKDRILRGEKE